MAEYADMFMVLGIILIGLASILLVNVFSHGRSYKRVIVMLILGGCMVAYANSSRPKGYTLQELPMLFVTVFSDG